MILQGRNQEGKTTLLRETIPRHRRWGPLALEGIYLNGAEGKSVDSFKEWLTTKMFGMTTTGGSEIAYNLQAYKSKQWFVGFLENLGLPIAPKPAIVLVDQFEELLKRFPVQALDWANTLTNQHTTHPALLWLTDDYGCGRVDAQLPRCLVKLQSTLPRLPRSRLGAWHFDC